MYFTNSEKDVREAINLLDNLVKSNPSQTMETIRRYKTKQEIDPFTSFRLKRELAKINNHI